MTEASLSGPKVLLMGPSGTGNTHALGTLVDWAAANGKEVFVLFTRDDINI
jgi:ribose 1,5-bisphosphokinase PhnN